MAHLTYYKSQGFSMEPFLLDGDELIVNTSPGLPYSIGDIVLYRSPSHLQPIAHRLVEVDALASSVAIRSDADPLMVEKLEKQAILGKVEYVRRGERLIRVNGTMATWLCNRAIAAARPATLWLKHWISAFLLPAVTMAQGTSFYRWSASKLLTADIRIDRTESSGEVRVIAMVNGRYAGSLDVQPRSFGGLRVAWVSGLSVRVRYRGVRIATQLLAAVEEEVHRMGMPEVRVEYEQGNRVAEALYRKMGFHVVDIGQGMGQTGMRALRRPISNVT